MLQDVADEAHLLMRTFEFFDRVSESYATYWYDTAVTRPVIKADDCWNNSTVLTPTSTLAMHACMHACTHLLIKGWQRGDQRRGAAHHDGRGAPPAPTAPPLHHASKMHQLLCS